MLYYKAEVNLFQPPFDPDDKKERGAYAREFHGRFVDFYESNNKETLFFISEIKDSRAIIGVFSRKNIITARNVQSFLMAMENECRIKMKIEEITFNAIRNLLRSSDRNDFIEETSVILELLGLYDIDDHLSFDEHLISGTVDKDTLMADTAKILCEATLTPEIDRIYLGRKVNVKLGHPVHYLINTDDKDVGEDMVEILTKALYSNKRIQSKRYTAIRFYAQSRIPRDEYENLYKSCFGGVIAITYQDEDNKDSGYANEGLEVITKICEAASKFKNQVLTIICLPRSCERLKSTFMENIGSTTLIELKEETVFGAKAKSYLKHLADNYGISGDRALYKCVSDPEKGFLAADLNKVFDSWYDNILRVKVYNQYSEFETANRLLSARKPKGSAYSQLNEMIGLADAKEVIGQALDFYKAQKMFKHKGIDSSRPAFHMVFTGQAGTAKTSVARLFARIMKENGLLSKGDLYEVGRADLVGQYVGWTAQIVKEKFRTAKGSVLFIDEAYALVDDSNSFGDEAINTIVAEMENNREDIVVIFAGYTDRMEAFLQKNQGLRSRIGFNIPFADYNADELYQITELLAKNNGVTLADNVREKLIPIYKSALNQSDFGNGRFARNLFEKAKLKQASRLVRMDVAAVTEKDVFTLIANDFEVPKASAPPTQTRKIGFVA